MCYLLYISTTSNEDLSRFNSPLITFSRVESNDNPCMEVLKNPAKRYVGSRSGCSCGFRHLMSVELGFGEPQDWYPEDEDDLRATAELYQVISRIVTGGDHVDCLDVWVDAEANEIKTMAVDLSVVPETTFRLFENHHFVFEHTGS